MHHALILPWLSPVPPFKLAFRKMKLLITQFIIEQRTFKGEKVKGHQVCPWSKWFFLRVAMSKTALPMQLACSN